MMYRYLWLLLLMVLPFVSEGQEVNGRVISASDLKAVPDVLVANKRTGANTYTDSLGKYKIEAMEGDLLFLYRIGYDAKRVTVRISGGSIPAIAIRPNELSLSEVEVQGSKYQMDSVERAIIYRKALNDANQKIEMYGGFGIGFSGLFSKLASIATGREKKLQHFKKQFLEGEKEKFISTRYNMEVVHSLTGLSGEDAGRFMNANPMPYEFARAATELELRAWIRDKFRQYSDKKQ